MLDEGRSASFVRFTRGLERRTATALAKNVRTPRHPQLRYGRGELLRAVFACQTYVYRDSRDDSAFGETQEMVWRWWAGRSSGARGRFGVWH